MIRVLTATLLFAHALAGSEVLSDGLRVRYESYGKGDDAVVFIHGWSCDRTFWRGQASVYDRVRALLVDLPGHGASEKPRVAYTQERFARAIDAVMRDAGVARAVLVGHSMGGPVAMTFLRLFPARVKAVVMVDAYIPQVPKQQPGAPAAQSPLAGFVRSLREPGYRETAGKAIESMFSDHTTPSQREEIRSKMLATPQHVMVSAMEGLSALQLPQAGQKISVPVLAVMAAKPGRESYEVRLREMFPNLTYEEWQGAGHFLMMESPDRFNRSLSAFLARVTDEKK